MHWIVSLFIAIYVCVWSVMSGVCWLLANNYAMHTRPFINDIITHKYTCSRVQPANDKPRFRLYIFDLFSESRCRNHLFIFRWPFCPLYGVCVSHVYEKVRALIFDILSFASIFTVVFRLLFDLFRCDVTEYLKRILIWSFSMICFPLFFLFSLFFFFSLDI